MSGSTFFIFLKMFFKTEKLLNSYWKRIGGKGALLSFHQEKKSLKEPDSSQGGRIYRALCLSQVKHQETGRLWSLSHTRGACLAISIDQNSTKKIERIGVDFERKDRKTSLAARKRVVSPAEESFDLEFLDYWVLKEAAFKANPRSAESILTQYQLIKWNKNKNQGLIQYGSLLIDVFRAETPSYVFGFALSKGTVKI